jgi:hypothetical protein
MIKIEKDMLAKMAVVNNAKETFSRDRRALEKKPLEKACNSWREKAAGLKWSERFFSALASELQRYCIKRCDVDQLNDQFNKTVREAYAIRDLVRRAGNALEAAEPLTTCADYCLQGIVEIEQLVGKAKKDMSDASDIPDKAAQCAKLASTGKLIKPTSKRYVAYARGLAD